MSLAYANTAHLGVEWDVLTGDDDGNYDSYERQHTNLGPQQRSLRCVCRLESESRKRPEVTVGIHAPREDENSV